MGHTQILSVMADNASSNDTLVTELVDLVPHFAGETSCCRDSFLARLVEAVYYLSYVRIFGAYIIMLFLHQLPV
jgi:hypothetical protein